MFHLSADFQTSMKELVMWRQQNYESAEPQYVSPGVHDEVHAEQAQSAEPLPDNTLKPVRLVDKGNEYFSSGVVTTHILKRVNPFKKKTKKKKRLLDSSKFQEVLQKLNQPPRIIQRLAQKILFSLCVGLLMPPFFITDTALCHHDCNRNLYLLINITILFIYRSISLVRTPVRPSTAQRLRSMSLPRQLDFSCFLKTHGGVQTGQDVRGWVRDIWNNWFDEVFPPSRASFEDSHKYYDMTGVVHTEQVTKEEASWAVGVDSIPPLLVEDPAASVEDVMGEIGDLTELIEQRKTPSVFHYCRRGALHRKIGNLTLALHDLDLVRLWNIEKDQRHLRFTPIELYLLVTRRLRLVQQCPRRCKDGP